MTLTEVQFGKHPGKTLPEIVLSDPDWFFWAIEKGIFTSPELKAEAVDIYQKATRIRVPVPNAVVEYVVHPLAGKLAAVAVVPKDSPAEGAIRLDRFDLSVPRVIAPYDKTGNKIMIRSLRDHVFGGATLTRERCEHFFEDKGNFLDPA